MECFSFIGQGYKDLNKMDLKGYHGHPRQSFFFWVWLFE